MKSAIARRVFTHVLQLIFLAISLPATPAAEAAVLGSDTLSRAEIEDVCKFVADIPAHRRPGYFLTAGMIDVNNDGVLELVADAVSPGTMHGMVFDIRDSNGRAITIQPAGFEWKDYWTFGAGWLPYKGKIYYATFKAEDFRFLSYLAFVAPDEREYVICTFDNLISEKPLLLSSVPATEGFCGRESRKNNPGASNLLPFDKARKDRFYELRRRRETHPYGYVDIDFDNDGDNDLLLYLEYASGAGRGCDVHYFDVMTPEGLPLDAGTEHDTLMRLQGIDLSGRHPGNCSGNVVRVFREQDVTYFHLKYRSDRPYSVKQMVNDIYEVKGTKITLVCSTHFEQTTEVGEILPHQHQ
jgi:hypothetical protein